MSASKPIRVLGLVFPNFNILDLTGPAEVFGSSRIAANERSLQIASATEDTSSSEGIIVKRQISFQEVLNSDRIREYDILLIPGAHATFIQNALDKPEGLFDIITSFARLPPSPAPSQSGTTGDRYLLSVCTGAILLGATGLLRHRTVTTHWACLDFLARICGDETGIVRKRFVDAGTTADGGVRVVTAGGVSCGMDAALWIASRVYGMPKAEEVVAGMDYVWEFGGEGGDGERTRGWMV